MEDADEKAKISSADLGTFQSRLGFHLPAVSCMYSDQAVYSRVCSCLLTIPNQTKPNPCKLSTFITNQH